MRFLYMALPIVVVLILMVWLLGLIRAHKIKEKYTIVWLLLLVVLLVFAVFPPVADSLSQFVGFKETSNFLLAGGVFTLLIANLHLSAAASSSEEKIRRLAEEVALLRQIVEKPGAGVDGTAGKADGDE